jgi:phosphosulfolactate phosphohydrolase-like enzyme
MQKELSLKLTPAEASDDAVVAGYIARSLGKEEKNITGFYRVRQSIDARSRSQVWINMTVHAFADEPFHKRGINTIFSGK